MDNKMDRDKEILEILKKESEKMKVPSSLQPDNIDALLTKKKPKRRSTKWVAIAATAAAVALCITTAYATIWKNHTADKSGNTEEIMTASTAQSYDELYDLFTYREDTFATSSGDTMYKTEDALTNSYAENTLSKTNVQVQGVDEGDIVKTQGDYIFIARQDTNHKIEIVKQNGKKLTKQFVLYADWDSAAEVEELYVDNNRLIAVGTDRNLDYELEDYQTGYGDSGAKTYVVIYDITNPQKPTKIASHTQDGSWQSSRYTEGVLYLFTHKDVGYFDKDDVKKDDKKKYVPYIDGEALSMSDIVVPQEKEAAGYFVASSMDASGQGNLQQRRAVVLNSDLFYVSNDYIYVMENDWGDNSQIYRFAYEKGTIGKGQCFQVKGQINDSFSVDEYQGKLRVVTTNYDDKSGESENGIYVFNEKCKLIGAVGNLAPDETIYSCRYFGDMAYFVTYRQTDPLFSVDLSDPTNPKVVGKLKIPGFSNYMQFYQENLLLGIGQEDGKVKLSMFDVSDPTDVKEKDKVILDYDDSQAIYNHHAVICDGENNLIGFPVTDMNGTDYLIYTYEKGRGFKIKHKQNTNAAIMNLRGVYNKDYFYLINPEEKIDIFSTKEYHKVGVYQLQ